MISKLYSSIHSDADLMMSVSSMVLTTEALVADKPEPPAPAAPAGMGDMGGMY